jgi:short-subunit dehydrogenase
MSSVSGNDGAGGRPRWNKAWVIGASTGIGRETALKLMPMCGELFVSARSEDKLAEVASRGAAMTSLPLDVTSSQQVGEAAARIASGGEPVDLVVISSGLWRKVNLPDIDPADFRAAMDVNFNGVIEVLSAVLPAMAKRGSGHVAIIASVSGYRGLPGASAYAPTKAALINLAECIKPQLDGLGITVTIINPGFVDTPMTSVNKFPMPFLMEPQEAASIIVSGLDRRAYEIAFPRKMAWPLKLARVLPNSLYFWLVRKTVMRG